VDLCLIESGSASVSGQVIADLPLMKVKIKCLSAYQTVLNISKLTTANTKYLVRSQ